MQLKTILFIILSFLLVLGANAQTCVVSGRATDGKEALLNAHVIMENAADTLQRLQTVSDDKGLFSVEVPKGVWLLKISYIGYASYETQVNVTDNIQLPDIKMDAQSVILKGTTVIGRSTTFNASGYTVNLNSHPMLKELKMDKALRLLPGVFGNETSLKVYNKNIDIYLDGIFVPLNFIDNLDADQIEKIDVIVNAGVSEDAAAMHGAVLKIYSNKKKNKSGRFRIYNTASEYSHGHSLLTPATMLGLRSGKLSLMAFLNGTLDFIDKNKQCATTNYHTLGYTQRRTAYQTTNNKDFSTTLNLTYNISEKSRVGLWTSYKFIRKKEHSKSYIANSRNDIQTGAEDNRGHGRNRTNNYTLSTNYAYIDKASEFSTAFSFVNKYFNNRNAQNSLFDNVEIAANERQSLYRSREIGRIYKWRADYFYRFREEKDKWEIGAAFTLWDQNNHTSAERLTNGKADNYGNYTDHYKYREQIAATYTSYDWKIDERWNVKAGVRMEHLVTDPKSSLMEGKHNWKCHHTDWFPQAAINWMIDEKHGHMLNIDYTRGITRPSHSNLNPAIIWTGEYNYTVGNPLLKPTYTNSIGLRNTLFNRYTWGANYNSGATTKYKYYGIDGTNITYSTPFTDGDYKGFDVYATWNSHARDYSWMMNFQIVYSYDFLHDREKTTHSQLFLLNYSGNFRLWQKYSLYFYGIYQSPIKSFNTKTGHQFNVSGCIEREFGNVSVKLGGGYSIRPTTMIKTTDYSMKLVPKWNDPNINVEFTYNIQWGNKRAIIRNSIENIQSETDRM